MVGLIGCVGDGVVWDSVGQTHWVMMLFGTVWDRDSLALSGESVLWDKDVLDMSGDGVVWASVGQTHWICRETVLCGTVWDRLIGCVG